MNYEKSFFFSLFFCVPNVIICHIYGYGLLLEQHDIDPLTGYNRVKVCICESMNEFVFQIITKALQQNLTYHCFQLCHHLFLSDGCFSVDFLSSHSSLASPLIFSIMFLFPERKSLQKSRILKGRNSSLLKCLQQNKVCVQDFYSGTCSSFFTFSISSLNHCKFYNNIFFSAYFNGLLTSLTHNKVL